MPPPPASGVEIAHVDVEGERVFVRSTSGAVDASLEGWTLQSSGGQELRFQGPDAVVPRDGLLVIHTAPGRFGVNEALDDSLMSPSQSPSASSTSSSSSSLSGGGGGGQGEVRHYLWRNQDGTLRQTAGLNNVYERVGLVGPGGDEVTWRVSELLRRQMGPMDSPAAAGTGAGTGTTTGTTTGTATASRAAVVRGGRAFPWAGFVGGMVVGCVGAWAAMQTDREDTGSIQDGRLKGGSSSSSSLSSSTSSLVPSSSLPSSRGGVPHSGRLSETERARKMRDFWEGGGVPMGRVVWRQWRELRAVLSGGRSELDGAVPAPLGPGVGRYLDPWHISGPSHHALRATATSPSLSSSLSSSRPFVVPLVLRPPLLGGAVAQNDGGPFPPEERNFDMKEDESSETHSLASASSMASGRSRNERASLVPGERQGEKAERHRVYRDSHSLRPSGGSVSAPATPMHSDGGEGMRPSVRRRESRNAARANYWSQWQGEGHRRPPFQDAGILPVHIDAVAMPIMQQRGRTSPQLPSAKASKDARSKSRARRVSELVDETAWRLDVLPPGSPLEAERLDVVPRTAGLPPGQVNDVALSPSRDSGSRRVLERAY